MLKNMKIGARLIIVGMILVLLPLALVSTIAIVRSTQGLITMEDEQLAARTKDLALMLDRVVGEEKKIVQILSIDPDIIAAAAALAEAGNGAQKGPSTADLVDRVNTKLATYAKTKGIGESYLVIVCLGMDGVTFAASDPSSYGVNASDRQFWKTAMEGTLNVGVPSLNKVSQKPQAPFAAPIRSGDKVVGVVATLVDISFLKDLVGGEKVGKTGYAVVVDNAGLVLAHPKEENVFKLDISKTPGMEAVSKKMMGGESGVGQFTLGGVAKTQGYAPVTSTGWSVALSLPDSEYLAPASDVRNLILIVSILAVLVTCLVYFLFARSITRPLAKGVALAQLVAGGDFTQQLDIRQKDEVGMLVTALNAMSARLREMVASIHESAEQVAASSEEITANAQKLAEGAQSQASTLEETSASVEELTASVDAVAGHAQSQAAAVEQGSASMAEVHQSIEAVSKNLEEIASLAGRSVENALQGAKAVSEVVEGINLIAGSSERIGGIVSVISDIADQTNLLALNASIEAARAGEHGRGFAVVADEVSKLADRSSTSTKEIEGLIRESVKNVTKGVETAKGSQAAMEQIRGASQKVKEMIAGLSDSMTQQVGAVKELARALENVSEMSQSISAATEEQTTNAKQVSMAVENVNDVTQSAASAAEEMSASTEQLSGMASALQRLMGQFKINSEGTSAIMSAANRQQLGGADSIKAGVLDADQIGLAIGAHGNWKLRLKEAIHTGKSQMEVATARADDRCAFGKWLYGLPEAARESETAMKVKALHAEFHEVVGHIMEMALAGKRTEAEKAMQRGGKFASLSNELTRVMIEWKESFSRTKDKVRELPQTR